MLVLCRFEEGEASFEEGEASLADAKLCWSGERCIVVDGCPMGHGCEEFFDSLDGTVVPLLL